MSFTTQFPNCRFDIRMIYLHYNLCKRKIYAPTENGEMAVFYMQIFMVYCAQYLANETELRQNILHPNYWW